MPIQRTPDRIFVGDKWVPITTSPTATTPITTSTASPATTTVTTTTSTVMTTKIQDPASTQNLDLESLIKKYGNVIFTKSKAPEIDDDEKLFIVFVNNTLATLVEKVDVLEWAEEANRKFTLLEDKYGAEVVKEYLRYINTDIENFKKIRKFWRKLLQSTENFTFDGTTVQIKPSLGQPPNVLLPVATRH